MTSGMVRSAWIAAVLLLAACTGRGAAPQVLTDAQILNALNQRAGAHACCFYMGKDPNGRPLYGRLNGARELHFVVRSQVGRDAVACGWSGFAAPLGANGRRMPAGPDVVFIVRDGQVYLQEDVPGEEFERWQDDLCGPAWIKPRMVGGEL